MHNSLKEIKYLTGMSKKDTEIDISLEYDDFLDMCHHEKEIIKKRDKYYNKFMGVDLEWDKELSKEITEHYYLESIGCEHYTH